MPCYAISPWWIEFDGKGMLMNVTYSSETHSSVLYRLIYQTNFITKGQTCYEEMILPIMAFCTVNIVIP